MTPDPHDSGRSLAAIVGGCRRLVTDQQKGTNVTYSAQIHRAPVGALRQRTAVLLAFLSVLLAACALSVKLVGDYDDLLDRSVMDLQTRTNEFYAKCETPSPPDPAQFFAESFGAIEAMTTRATIIEEGLARQPLTENLGALKLQFEDAKGKVSGNPLVRSSSLKALNEAFKAIQIQLVWMKKTQTQRPRS